MKNFQLSSHRDFEVDRAYTPNGRDEKTTPSEFVETGSSDEEVKFYFVSKLQALASPSFQAVSSSYECEIEFPGSWKEEGVQARL